jgi:hypothetical protein
VLFTTGQLRSAFDLSKQQWRSYRDALPPLATDQGRAACFTAADLLATSVVHRACRALSAPLSTFTPVAHPLFELLAACPWPQLERSRVLIELESGRVQLIVDERQVGTAIVLIIELAPLMAELRQHLLATEFDPQRELAFPPTVAGTGR